MSTPRPSYESDKRVDDYIDALPDWQQTICRELRDLIHAADPEISETIKRSVQPYFVLDGTVCALLATKDHVNLFLYDGGIVPDPEGIITARSSPTTAPEDGANSSATAAAEPSALDGPRADRWPRVAKKSRTRRFARDVDPNISPAAPDEHHVPSDLLCRHRKHRTVTR